MNEKLGTLDKIEDLRTVWKHEAIDFTPWLCQEKNLKLLGDTLGMSLVLDERESKVGAFSVDILAKDEITDKTVIIENQLEDTNHDHLGKLITYASGKDAKLIIWIVKHAREEHQKAIEWLNNHIDSDIYFWLLEIELYKIGDSMKAPKFNIVERPNEWAKNRKTEDTLSETSSVQLEFWEGYYEYAKKNQNFYNSFLVNKPMPRHSCDLKIKHKPYYIYQVILLKQNKLLVGIYIPDSKESYQRFLEQKDVIEKKLAQPIDWHEATKICSISIEKEIDLSQRKEWNNAYQWFQEKALLLKEISGEII